MTESDFKGSVSLIFLLEINTAPKNEHDPHVVVHYQVTDCKLTNKDIFYMNTSNVL